MVLAQNRDIDERNTQEDQDLSPHNYSDLITTKMLKIHTKGKTTTKKCCRKTECSHVEE